jgi:hypothetical protein
MAAHTHTWRFDGEDTAGVRFRCTDCGAQAETSEVSL